MPPSSSSGRSSWAASLAAAVAAGLLALAPCPALGEPEERPRHRWDLGVDLIGLWGVALRAGWEHDDGAIDMLGLRTGYVAGPSPLFGSERSLAAAFAAPTVDLFAEQEWQLELCFGPAAVDRDERGRATIAFDDRWGFVSGMAARYKTPAWFQINLGVLMISDHRFYERVVVVDIGPSWVW